MKKNIMMTLFILVGGVLAACSSGETLTVGTQTYSETKTIGYIYKELIEDSTDLSVDVKTDMSTDTLVLEAMMNDELQIGTTYTGTALASFFEVENPRDREATMQQTQEDFKDEYNIKVYDELGFANTYALAVTEDFAEEHDLEEVSDLESLADDLSFGSDTSWMERTGDDGYEAFQELYGFEFGDASPMNPNLVYDALKNGDHNVVLAYSTDARVETYNLKILEDNKQFFPPYDASSYVNQEVIDEYPELDDIFSDLVGELDLETIHDFNIRVDEDGEEPHDVAKDYLEEQGMLE